VRARRDRGWALLRRAWLEGADVAAEADAYAGDRPLDAAYAEAVAAADQAADGLRDAGERVVKDAQARAGLEACEREAGALAARRDALLAELRALDERWRTDWSAVGVVPGPPAQMQGWL